MRRSPESINLPVEGMLLPVRFTPPAPISDEELFVFSSRNEVAWIERDANGDISVKPISGTLVGMVSGNVMCELALWLDGDGRRGELRSGAGFFLPDGSMFGAHLALIGPEKIASIADKETDGFPSFAPDFVVEFASCFDQPGEMERKMTLWIANGVELAWLIDPIDKTVAVYRPGAEPEHHANPTSVQGTGPIAGFELVLSRVWD